MSIIKPTVGRKVWFRPSSLPLRASLEVHDGQPCDATILYVWNDRRVNLLVAGPTGVTQRLLDVTLRQSGDAPPISAFSFGYAEWMPCQQVAKPDVAARPQAEVSGETVPRCRPLEDEIVAKGLTAPRITPKAVEDAVVSEYFFTAMDAVRGDVGIRVGDEVPLSLLTFCVLVMRNGFTVTGESACASPQSFDAAIGRRVARENAIAKAWQLEGYLLKQRLSVERPDIGC